jgi:hypothetical protein
LILSTIVLNTFPIETVKNVQLRRGFLMNLPKEMTDICNKKEIPKQTFLSTLVSYISIWTSES